MAACQRCRRNGSFGCCRSGAAIPSAAASES
ncbi:MAG: hypothetical protein FJ202_05650 [Gemmatimonadetes bacterium]|nr:hypothetical protein [Gemmatimonadota bacterium]